MSIIALSVFLPSALISFADESEQGKGAVSDAFIDPYFGITMQEPPGWYKEGDNPWNHADINPWHLPMIPIKELQPTAVDLLIEGKKTMILYYEADDDSSASMRMSVEKIPFGMTLDQYVQHTVERIKKNTGDAVVEVNVTKKTLQSDGNPAVSLVVTLDFEEFDSKAREMQLLTIYGNLAYIIQYDSPLEYYEANLATAKLVQESVSITPPQSRAQALLLPTIVVSAGVAAVIAVKIRKRDSRTRVFFRETKRILPAAFGIEVLCVASAEIGGLLGLYYFGFNPFGIAMAYLMAYALAGFTTFASILGRGSSHMHGTGKAGQNEIACCGDIEHDAEMGFAWNIKATFANFGVGLSRMKKLYRQPDAWKTIKTSLIVLISAESGCIIAAATVDVMMYQYSTFLSIPSALLAGTFTVAFIAAFRSSRSRPVKEQKLH